MKKTLATMLALGFVVAGVSGCSVVNKSTKNSDEVVKESAAPTLTFAEAYIEESVTEAEPLATVEEPADDVAHDNSNTLQAGVYENGKNKLELFEDGTAVMSVDGKDINLTWDSENFYSDEEFPNEAAKYNYDGGHLHFGYESKDGYLSYDFNFDDLKEESQNLIGLEH